MELVYGGKANGVKYWIMLNYINSPIKLEHWYCAYIQLPFIIRPNIEFSQTPIEHELITGYPISYELFDRAIDVHGGFTFGLSDEEKTIIGWDYNHFNDTNVQLSDVIKDAQYACKQLTAFKELQGRTISEQELERIIMAKIQPHNGAFIVSFSRDDLALEKRAIYLIRKRLSCLVYFFYVFVCPDETTIFFCFADVKI